MAQDDEQVKVEEGYFDKRNVPDDAARVALGVDYGTSRIRSYAHVLDAKGKIIASRRVAFPSGVGFSTDDSSLNVMIDELGGVPSDELESVAYVIGDATEDPVYSHIMNIVSPTKFILDVQKGIQDPLNQVAMGIILTEAVRDLIGLGLPIEIGLALPAGMVGTGGEYKQQYLEILARVVGKGTATGHMCNIEIEPYFVAQGVRKVTGKNNFTVGDVGHGTADMFIYWGINSSPTTQVVTDQGVGRRVTERLKEALGKRGFALAIPYARDLKLRVAEKGVYEGKEIRETLIRYGIKETVDVTKEARDAFDLTVDGIVALAYTLYVTRDHEIPIKPEDLYLAGRATLPEGMPERVAAKLKGVVDSITNVQHIASLGIDPDMVVAERAAAHIMAMPYKGKIALASTGTSRVR